MPYLECDKDLYGVMHWPENETGIASRVGNNNAALSVVVDTAGHTPAHTHTHTHTEALWKFHS